MASQFTREQIKLCVAKICLTAGWSSSMTTPLETLTDILSNYLYQLGKTTKQYANGLGMIEPNLYHLGLAFRDFHINVTELEKYIKNVVAEPPAAVPKYPLPRDEHYLLLEADKTTAEVVETEPSEEATTPENSNGVFKRPGELNQNESCKSPRLFFEEQGQHAHEISSVIMTTSGFILPRKPFLGLEVSSPVSTPLSPRPQQQLLQQPQQQQMVQSQLSQQQQQPLQLIEPIKKPPKVEEEIKQESRESSPDLIIDESPETSSKVHHLSNDITIELINSVPPAKSAEKTERLCFDDNSPPGRPSTPKTPEMMSHSPPLNRSEKRKRKDKFKIKKMQKQISPNRLDSEPVDVDMERPKIPKNAAVGPGLIPPPIPSLNISSFSQRPYMPPVDQRMSLNFMPPIKPDTFYKITPPLPSPSLDADIISSKVETEIKNLKKEKKDQLKKKNKEVETKTNGKNKKDKEDNKENKEIADSKILVPKLTLKHGSALPHSELSDATRKLNLKPIIRKDEDVRVVKSKREMSPELAKTSALVTDGQPKLESTSINISCSTSNDNFPFSSTDSFQSKKTRKPPAYETDTYKTSSIYIDAEGNKVRICPACRKQDDGSSMIGCGDCDAWYHWVCAGIQVPPDDSEDWYCRLCISEKQDEERTKNKKQKKKDY